MKKKSIALALSALMVTGLVGCGNSSEGENKAESTLKVGMVTDSGTIDDKSFNKILYSNFDISTLRLTKQLAEEYRNNMKKDKKYLQVVIQGFEKINNWI